MTNSINKRLTSQIWVLSLILVSLPHCGLTKSSYKVKLKQNEQFASTFPVVSKIYLNEKAFLPEIKKPDSIIQFEDEYFSVEGKKVQFKKQGLYYDLKGSTNSSILDFQSSDSSIVFLTQSDSEIKLSLLRQSTKVSNSIEQVDMTLKEAITMVDIKKASIKLLHSSDTTFMNKSPVLIALEYENGALELLVKSILSLSGEDGTLDNILSFTIDLKS